MTYVEGPERPSADLDFERGHRCRILARIDFEVAVESTFRRELDEGRRACNVARVTVQARCRQSDCDLQRFERSRQREACAHLVANEDDFRKEATFRSRVPSPSRISRASFQHLSARWAISSSIRPDCSVASLSPRITLKPEVHTARYDASQVGDGTTPVAQNSWHSRKNIGSKTRRKVGLIVDEKKQIAR